MIILRQKEYAAKDYSGLDKESRIWLKNDRDRYANYLRECRKDMLCDTTKDTLPLRLKYGYQRLLDDAAEHAAEGRMIAQGITLDNLKRSQSKHR